MKSNKWRDWLEVVGIFSVVASLIFVGLQMRQAHEISLSQAYQARTTVASEWNVALASNQTALSAYNKFSTGQSQSVSDGEFQALHRMIVGLLHIYDNAHYQYQQGFVSEQFWSATRSSMEGWMRNGELSAIFVERMNHQGRPEFKNVVRAIDEELRLGTEE